MSSVDGIGTAFCPGGGGLNREGARQLLLVLEPFEELLQRSEVLVDVAGGVPDVPQIYEVLLNVSAGHCVQSTRSGRSASRPTNRLTAAV
jgi:hypothetical protein